MHSFITLQAWVNHLCSYETSRQVLLHFADGDHKARDKMSQLCLQRNFVPEPVFKCSLLACCLQGLIAFEAVLLQALRPQAILAASSETSSIHNKHGMGGGQCSGAGMSNPEKTDMRNDWISVTLNNWNQISSSKKVHHRRKSNLPIWNPWLSLK